MSHHCISKPCWICNPEYPHIEGSWQSAATFFPPSKITSHVLIEISESNGDIWSVSSHNSLEAAQKAAQDKVNAYIEKNYDQAHQEQERLDNKLYWTPQRHSSSILETDPVNVTLNDPVYFRIYDCTK